jgi:PAS domain S-box-containing protein
MFLTVYNCVAHAHDLRLVGLAAVICALASFTAINLLHHVRGSQGRMRLAWLAVSATATGFGIWATHFIAMLAFSPGLPTAYNIALTFLSLIAAIVLTGFGLAVALSPGRRLGPWLGGAMVGGGIAAMHYTGMAAFEIQGRIVWDPLLVAISIALGGLIGAVALPVGLRGASLKWKISGALLLTVAICSHHFTAMAAAAIIPDPTVEFSAAALPTGWLAIAVAFASFIIILLALAGVGVDLRDRRRTELETERMWALANAAVEGLLVCDGETILTVNESFATLAGAPAERLVGSQLSRFFPEDNIRLKLFEFANAPIEGDLVKVDGSRGPVELIHRQIDFAGRTRRVIAVRDIEARKRAEQERDRNRELLNRIIDNVTMSIHVKDARTLRYVLVNKAAEQLWGIPGGEMIGKTPHEIFDKEVADRVEGNDQELLQLTSNFYQPEHKVQTREGERLVTSNRIAIRNNDGEVQYIVGVIEDVTERKAVADQLRQAQKMEAIGNLTGGVAHDFNNLLTVIMGNLDLLQEDVAGNPAAAEAIKVVLEAAERGADLTRHMLAFSRRQSLQAKAVDVNALIATTMRMLNRTLGETIVVELQTAADLPAAMVDPSQLETALVNIAINARDAMPNGGTLTINTRTVEFDETYAAQHPGVRADRYVCIALADSGTGVPPEMLERIFEPFFTTKAAGQGTGLGLSMVYGFVKQSGGHITAYSEVGRGTVFKLFLPLAAPTLPTTTAPPLVPHAAKRAGNEVILAVEDNPDIRATVVRHLRDLGYRVCEADNADAALKILEAAEPIDLLFTDMIMPGGINGKELATKARAKRADLKVLFTSGFPGTSSAPGTQLEASDVLLSKPYHKHELARAVEEVLSAGG